jgi:drug/metabolite transporter (DMT)-like permease
VHGTVSWKDWICVALIVLGVVLFLIGSNIYNAYFGWAGVFLFVGGIVALIVMYIYNALKAEQSAAPQNP